MNEYVMIENNFKKMLLILYRILANIPVILMGERGCGKKALIRILNQLLNEGEEKLKIFDMNQSFTEEIIIEKKEKINEKAKKMSKKELWIYFDKLNTCDSFCLIKEIFINRTFNGKKLEDNIRLMGACYPYKKREKNKINYGLTYPNDDNESIDSVNILPQSLMYYVFNFGIFEPEDEIKYISNIISNLFNKDGEKLKKKTENCISKCLEYLRNNFDYTSLREINIFKKYFEFFMDYYKKKFS